MGISRSRGDAELVKCFRETIQTTGLNLYVGLIPVVNWQLPHNGYRPQFCVYPVYVYLCIALFIYYIYKIVLGILHFNGNSAFQLMRASHE